MVLVLFPKMRQDAPLGREAVVAIQYGPRYATRNDEIVAGLREGAGAGPPIDPYMRIKRLIAEAAIQTALLYGGDWRVQLEPENGLVLIARRRKRPRRNL